MDAAIGIVDDHPAIRLGITALLNGQDGLRVAAALPTLEGLLAGESALDIVLLDLSLNDGSHVGDNVARIRAAGIPVLAYTSGDQPALLRDAARAGASGVVRKSEDPDAVVAAVRTVLAGGVAASSDWAAALEEDHAFASAGLSEREREVLALYAAGETADRVAAALYISRDTVIDHVRRIRAKYAAAERPARTKVDLYRRALEDGLVDDD